MASRRPSRPPRKNSKTHETGTMSFAAKPEWEDKSPAQGERKPQAARFLCQI